LVINLSIEDCNFKKHLRIKSDFLTIVDCYIGFTIFFSFSKGCPPFYLSFRAFRPISKKEKRKKEAATLT
jgi:hypothetical protein